MDIEWLEDFLVLSDLSSFTRAAQARNVTQSAFSRRIRSLEEWVGLPLIDRDTVPPRLTMAGHLFRDAAREMVRQLQDARVALGHKSKSFAGIKFYVSDALAQQFLSAWIANLSQRVSGLKFDVCAAETFDGMLALSEGRCDMLMSYHSPLAPLNLDEKAYPSIYLGNDRLIPVCAPNESGEPRFPMADARSRQMPLLSYPPETFFGRLCNGILRFSSNCPQMNVIAQSANSRVLHSLALHGIGVAWLPERCVKADLHAGLLVLAGADSWCSSLEIRLSASQDRAKLLQPNLWENIRVFHEESAAAA